MVHLGVALTDNTDDMACFLCLLNKFLTGVPADENRRHNPREQYKITYCQDGNGLWDIHIEQVVDITVNVCYHLKCLVLILVTHITLITSNYL